MRREKFSKIHALNRIMTPLGYTREKNVIRKAYPCRVIIHLKKINSSLFNLQLTLAAFISERMVLGLGLTATELIVACASAIKYARQQNKAARLINLMLRFGLGLSDD